MKKPFHEMTRQEYEDFCNNKKINETLKFIIIIFVGALAGLVFMLIVGGILVLNEKITYDFFLKMLPFWGMIGAYVGFAFASS